MRKLLWITTLLYHCQWLLASGAFPQSMVTISFYSENISINYNANMLVPRCGGVDEKSISSYYKQLEQTDYQTLLTSLQEKSQQLGLNDWLFYTLMRASVREIFQKKSRNEQELTCWFLLSQAGFDTRLTYLDDRVYVYVYSTDEIFEVPMIQDKGKTYVNLTNNTGASTKQEDALYLLNFTPRTEGKSFGFALKALPKLGAVPAKRAIRFAYHGTPVQMEVEYDKTLVEVMKDYPLIAEKDYLELPMSEVLCQSLLPQFRELTKNKTIHQTVELLLAFTRSSFEYKEDKEYFGRSKPMVTDEVFYYPYSDCEDRSAIFYQLVKELLGLPMIVVAFPDHLTIAVKLDEDLQGAVINYNDQRYYICDPTGPVNSSEIGVFPKSYEKSDFEIIAAYK